MTVHLISVGLSMLDALREPDAKLGDEPDLIDMIERYRPHEMLTADIGREEASGWLTGALAAPGEPGHEAAGAGRLREMSAAVRPDKWPRTISAEVETFDRVDDTRFPLPEEDVAILICSDTPLGLLAGVWNALALSDGDFDRVRYLPEPGAPLTGVRGSAVLARIRGMDAGSPKGFQQAMDGLGLLARHVFRDGQLQKAEEFRFYLSGGFKAAIPYLIGLAEAVRSVDGRCLRALGVEHVMPDHGPYPVRAFVLHETAGPGAPSIRLPLRMLVAGAVREELAVFRSNGRFQGELPRDLLSGYAYEAVGAREYELTAFGAGLRVLFGFGPEGFTG
jgi:hypothetical protein